MMMRINVVKATVARLKTLYSNLAVAISMFTGMDVTYRLMERVRRYTV